MDAIASQITSLTIVYSTVYSDADQRKHQSSASLAFVRGIHRWPVNSSHKWPVTRKMFPFDDVIMLPCWCGPGAWRCSVHTEGDFELDAWSSGRCLRERSVPRIGHGRLPRGPKRRDTKSARPFWHGHLSRKTCNIHPTYNFVTKVHVCQQLLWYQQNGDKWQVDK